VKLLLDEMISDQVAKRLADRGRDAVAVTAELELRSLDDHNLFSSAQSMGRVVVTYNVVDFQPIVSDWAADDREHHGVVFVSNTTIPQSDLARLTDALERFLDSFAPWPSFVHWLSEDG